MTCKYQGLIPGLFILYKLLKPRIENDSELVINTIRITLKVCAT